MLIDINQNNYDNTIKLAAQNLLKYQNIDGSFSGDVDFSIWADAAYLVVQDRLKIDIGKSQLIRVLSERQNADGSWGPLSISSDGDYKITVFAYEALKKYLTKVQRDKVCQWLDKYESNKWIDPYTEMFITKEGEKFYYPPPEIVFFPQAISKGLGYMHMLLPNIFNWSIFLFPSAWTRNALPQLQITGTLKSGRKEGFVRKRALEKLEKILLSKQLKNGSWFDTILPTLGAIYALNLLGYSEKSKEIKSALEYIESRRQQNGSLNRFDLKIWNTALAVMALLEVDDSILYEPVKKAIYFLLSSRSSKGGWAFTPDNIELTDNDDTALVLIALSKAKKYGYKFNDKNINDGIKYLLKRQNRDGGWSAFDTNQSRKRAGLLPPYHVEYGHELKDPSTADVTGHVLWALGETGIDIKNSRIRKTIRWLENDKVSGYWYGRWGLCYLYGTPRALIGAKKAGVSQSTKWVQEGLNWLISVQNKDGGWGEDYRSYYSEEPILGDSTVDQTAWSIICLLEYGISYYQKYIEKGISYLLNQQRCDGSFPSAYTAAAIEPANYKIYSAIFPLMALSKYKNLWIK